jgi:hypothetical protein
MMIRYPTTSMPYYQMGPIGMQLRSLLNANGLSTVRVIGYEHNWARVGRTGQRTADLTIPAGSRRRLSRVPGV